MDRQTFTWGRSRYKIRRNNALVEKLWVLGLLLAALLLFGINLGNLPLVDGNEATVALVAREIARLPIKSWEWLYPTFLGKPYLEQPPLLHWLIAGVYKVGGVNEWTTRLPSAILGAISVPLLYTIGREVFPSRHNAIFSGLIYLTLIPLVCLGRLATVDGTALCFVLLMMWSVLRSRRDLRWALGVGIGLGLICLTKGILFGVALLAIALLFLSWDTPRLLTSGYWWMGLLLGIAPAVAWYTVGVLRYGETLLTVGMINQSLQQIWQSVATHSGSPWYYPVELLKFIPWLLFFPGGLWLAWKNRNWGWAKLVLVWVGIYSLTIALLVTKLSWYPLPVYPALALAGGVQLAEIWYLPTRQSYSRVWSIGLSLLALGAVAGSAYFGIIAVNGRTLSVIFASVGLTALISAVLVARRDLQFIVILFWGMYVSLLLLITSPYWTWQWQQGYPVKPVAAILQHYTVNGQRIYASFPNLHPSLNFYSDRQVIPASNSELKQHWEQDEQPYLLLDTNTRKQLSLEPALVVGQAQDWVLMTKDNN